MKKSKQELTLVATAEDRATKEFFAVIRYRNIRGARRKVNVPLAELNDLRALEKLLANAGAYFTVDKDAKLEALSSLRASMDGAPHWVFAPAVGWFGDKKFVHAGGVIGIANQKQRVKPPRKLAARAANLRRGGTLEGWRLEVATPARRSSRMVMAICASFGAPLLRMSGMGSFALFVTGNPRSGRAH